MKESNLIMTPEQAVRRLAIEHPEWLPVLEAAVTVAANVEAHGGEFARPGSWMSWDGEGHRVWIPNLRILVSYGLIEKSGPSTRGGRRAYYRMPDRGGEGTQGVAGQRRRKQAQESPPHRGGRLDRTASRYSAAGR